MNNLKWTDPSIYNLISQEELRQKEKIRLIASENYVSKAVLEATGSILTNKYSEGYVGKRYYEGQQVIDQIETLAIERAKALFGAEHANVQPFSGAPANIAVYTALLKPGDTILSMELSHGGHLTHGSKVSVSGKYYNFIHYTVDPVSHVLDFDKIESLALQHKPKLIVCGYTVYPRIIDFKKFREIADKTGAYLMADMAHIAGLVAGGVHPSPVPYADVVTTTTHKSLRGPRAGMILCKKKYQKQIDRGIFPATQAGPHNHSTAAIAVALEEASKPEFKVYTKNILKNAQTLASTLLNSGIKLISDGTDNHLMLLDFSKEKFTGKDAAKALDIAGIVTNFNTVPFDKKGPANPSGLRIGTPAVTTRGFGHDEMVKTGELIIKAIKNMNDLEILEKIALEVKELCSNYPVP